MYLGIDPGKNGGVAVLTPDGAIMGVIRMPDPFQLADYFDKMRLHSTRLIAYLERVGSMPGQGVRSTFTFGEGYGIIQGLLIALRIPFETVTPYQWQRSIHRGVKGSQNPKERTLRGIRQIYPEFDPVLPGCRVPHSGVVDALAIATYGRRLTLNHALNENITQNGKNPSSSSKKGRSHLQLCDEDG